MSGMCCCYLLFILCLNTMYVPYSTSYPSRTVSSTPEAVVVRQNFGSLFHYQGILDDSHSIFRQTFIIPHIQLPSDFGQKLQCPLPLSVDVTKFNLHAILRDNQPLNHTQIVAAHERKDRDKLCRVFDEAYQNYYFGKDSIIANIKRYYRLLTSLSGNKVLISALNNTDHISKHPLDFLGELISDLSGIPGPQEFADLVEIVQSMEIYSNISTSHINNWMKETTSLYITTNDRITNILKAVQHNRDTATTLMSYIQTINLSINQLDRGTHHLKLLSNRYLILAAALSQVITSETRNLLLLETTLQRRVLAVQSLLNNKLSSDLISPSELSLILKKLQRHLNRKYNGFKVSHTSLSYYYTEKCTKFVQSDKYLYVSLAIPVSSQSLLYHLYKLHVFQTPISALPLVNSHHSTALQEPNRFSALSQDKHY